MAGRPRKPTNLLEMGGAFKKNPGRQKARLNEPKPTGDVGPPPAHWSTPSSYVKGVRERIWNEYVEQFPPGLLTNTDRSQLEQLCIATYEARRPGKQQIRWSAEVTKILRLFGGNPVDRARISIDAGSAPEDSLDAFTRRKVK
jgi:hypothetical protein